MRIDHYFLCMNYCTIVNIIVVIPMRRPKPILLIDDDLAVLRGLKRTLTGNFEVEVCQSGEDAVAAVDAGRNFSVFVCDQSMNGMTGTETLSILKVKAPSTPRILLTGHADQKNLMEGINQAELFRVIEKPCSKAMLETTLFEALDVSEGLSARTFSVEKSVLGSILMLRDILAILDIKPGIHRQRILELAHDLIDTTKCCPVWVIDAALMLTGLEKLYHLSMTTEGYDVNKMEGMQFGPKILNHIPRMKPVSDALFYTNKGYDGSGYPSNLIAGEMIPAEARLLRLLIAFETQLDSGLSEAESIKRIIEFAHTHDPVMLSELISLTNRIEEFDLVEFDTVISTNANETSKNEMSECDP